MKIFLIVFFLFSILFGISFFVLLNKYRKILIKLTNLSIDNSVMLEYIDIVKHKENISDEIADKENFIKFLSDSRNFAFEYIEDVQNALKIFIDKIDNKIKYFDEYGDVVAMKPNYETLKEISLAYKELKKIMPEEINDKT